MISKARRCYCGRHMINPDGTQAAAADLGAHCPACDRLKCGNCKCRVGSPTAQRCNCGRDLRLHNRQP